MNSVVHWIINHHWLRIRRSPDLQRNITSNVVMGIIVFLLVLNVLSIGLVIPLILRRGFPGRNPVDVFNGVLLYYFAVDLVMRFFLQKIHTFVAAPYLLLPIRRRAIVHFILLKSVLSWFNLIPLFLLVPVTISTIAPNSSSLAAVSWIISLFFCMLSSTYLTTYLKNSFISSIVPALVVTGILLAAGLLERFHILSLSVASSLLFGSVVHAPWLVFIPAAFLAALYALNAEFLRIHLYLDDIHAHKPRIPVREILPFLHGFGVVGTYMALEIKMLLRSKRARPLLVLAFLMIFYGLFFYPIDVYRNYDVILLFAGMFVTASFVFFYVTYIFSWESSYFGAIITRNVDPLLYLKAKYFLTLALSGVAYVLSIAYVVFGVRIVLINTVVFLFNAGVSTFILMYFATFNKVRFDLGVNVFSLQGKTGLHYSAFFIVFAANMAVFLPLKFLFNNDVAFVMLGAVGLCGLMLQNRILRFIARQFTERKYVMAAGFRQT